MASSPLRVGVGGPVGSGKTTLVEVLCKRMRDQFRLAVVTNDIYTREDERLLVIRDYVQDDSSWDLEQAIETLSDLDTDHLFDAEEIAHLLHLSGEADELDSPVAPKGYRMLARIPRIPDEVSGALVHHCGSLEKLMRSSVQELADVTDVGESWARTVKDALTRIAESSILDRYN